MYSLVQVYSLVQFKKINKYLMTPPKSYSAKLFSDHKPGFSFAEVVFNLPIKDVFTYEIPPHFRGLVKKGMRVFVPFGRRRLTGYVIGISNQNEKNIKLKNIEEVPDSEPVISKELLSLTRWIADYYHSSWGEAIKAALPAGLDDKSLEKLYLTEQGIKATIENNQSTLSTLILQTLRLKKSLTSKQLERCLKKQYSPNALAKLKRDGLVGTGNQIKRSSLRYEYEKIVHLAKNLPKQQEIQKLLKRSPKQRETYEYICRGQTTI